MPEESSYTSKWMIRGKLLSNLILWKRHGSLSTFHWLESCARSAMFGLRHTLVTGLKLRAPKIPISVQQPLKFRSQHTEVISQPRLPQRGRKRAFIFVLGLTTVGCGAYYASLTPRERRLVHVGIGGIGRFFRSVICSRGPMLVFPSDAFHGT